MLPRKKRNKVDLSAPHFALKWRQWLGALSLALLVSASATAQQLVPYPINDNELHLFNKNYDTGEIKRVIETGENIEPKSLDSAILFYQKGLHNSEQAGYAYGAMLSLLNLGNAYEKKGNYNKAFLFYQAAIPYCIKSQQRKISLAEIYSVIAGIYEYQGDYEQSARFYYKAVLLGEKFLTTAALGNIYNNLSTVLIQLKQHDKALYYLNKAEKIAYQQQNEWSLATVFINKGNIYAQRKDLINSQLYFEAALKLARKHHMLRVLYSGLINMGSMYLAKNDPQKALSYLLETQSLKGEVNPFYKNNGVKTLGAVYYRLHNYALAEHFLLNALDTAQALHLSDDLMQVHQLLAALYAETGSYQKAFAHQNAYSLLKDSIENEGVTKTVNQLEVKYRSAEKDKQLVDNQLLIARQRIHLEHTNTWIWISTLGSFLLAVAFSLLFLLYRYNRHKQYLQAEKMRVMEQNQEIQLLKAMMTGEEKERSRIARELHDGIGGMLTAVNLNLNAIQKRHHQIPQMQDLTSIIRMLQSTAVEVRKTAHNLTPDIFLSHHFTEALHIYCEHINNSNELYVDLQFFGELDQLDNTLTFSLYRIIQELVQNTVKHAHATQLGIQIRRHQELVSITVDDNGVGFNSQQQPQGTGLHNLHARVHALQGYISIESTQGRGTTAYIELDLQKNKSTTAA